MAKVKQPKFLFDGLFRGLWYVRAWKERREIVVQVWNGEKPDGDPAGDWSMPGVLGLEAAIAQGVIQTKS